MEKKIKSEKNMKKKGVTFEWHTCKEKGGVVVRSGWDGKPTKKDSLNCIESVMAHGKITLVDLLEYFSPLGRYKYR